MLYYTLYLGHLEDWDTNQNVLVSNHDDMLIMLIQESTM